MSISFGLFDVSLEKAAADFFDWKSSMLVPHGFRLTQMSVPRTHNLDLVSILNPRKNILPTKFLFVSTASGRTLYMDNFRTQTDRGAIRVVSERLNVDAIYAHVDECADLDAWNIPDLEKNIYPATMFDVYKGAGNLRRSIYSVNDGGRWVFGEAGERFEGEDVSTYTDRIKRKRFGCHQLV